MLVPSLSPSTPTVSPPYRTTPPPLTIQGHVPSILPSPSPVKKTAASMPLAAPVATSRNLPQNSPVSHPGVPGTLSPSSHQSNAPDNKAPILEPITPDFLLVAFRDLLLALLENI
ncbi:classical arabinogalactan protein 7-like [Quercus robur]|uniref:classical arabinogalactan protein 7-like n=1 Tax=Quercus robur TaxID=38942 RepID=UPI002162E1B9|nr:classical arabinogalactan protein 7-like [Quercus robur]